MASLTRVNGGTGAHGTQGSVMQLKCFEVDAIVDISAKGGVDSTIETIVREFLRPAGSPPNPKWSSAGPENEKRETKTTHPAKDREPVVTLSAVRTQPRRP